MGISRHRVTLATRFKGDLLWRKQEVQSHLCTTWPSPAMNGKQSFERFYLNGENRIWSRNSKTIEHGKSSHQWEEITTGLLKLFHWLSCELIQKGCNSSSCRKCAQFPEPRGLLYFTRETWLKLSCKPAVPYLIQPPHFSAHVTSFPSSIETGRLQYQCIKIESDFFSLGMSRSF